MTHEIRSSKLAAPIGPYSQGMKANGQAFLSGQIGQDPGTGKVVEGGVAAQTERALQNLSAVLEAAGVTFSDVVRVGIYLTDMSHFAEMNAVHGKYFNAPYPARTTIAVAGLPLGAAVEIDAIVRA